LPDFQLPASAEAWTRSDIDNLVSAFNGAYARSSELATSRLDTAAIKTALQNIQFEDVEVAVRTGAASDEVIASAADVNFAAPPVLSAAEMNAQLEAGDLYVNSRGQFFLNRQPTNARDASVAAMVISGTKQNDKLNDMMNKINLNNTKIQMATTLSAVTSIADLRESIASMKEQYGFADILSEITGGALTDGDVVSDMDISTDSTFLSTLKTSINNATRNQDLDTQSLQQLTAQIQANNTAMTQLIQSFEQLFKSMAQNLR
jgi:hypothetical protein